MNALQVNENVSLNEVLILSELQAKTRYNIGRNRLLDIANEAGAGCSDRVQEKRIFTGSARRLFQTQSGIGGDNMKSDFITIKQQLPGIVRVVSDFYQTPRKKGSVLFVKSPATHDRTASLAIYPNSNRFCDFANGNHSGDIIGFISYVRGCNNWEALQILKDFYGLADSREQGRQEAQRRIQLQQEQERKKQERRQAFYLALRGEIDRLKRWEGIYRASIEKAVFEPFSDLWAYCVNELQKTEYRLDILCAADCREYMRLKPYHENLPSDRPQWLLDVLAVLADGGAFTATDGEIKEITAQRDFELTRKPGAAVRRCGVDW